MSTPETRVEETLVRYHRSEKGGPTRASVDHVVVALAGGPESATLLSRGARLAMRAASHLYAVHVVRPGRDGDLDPTTVARLRSLADDVGGSLHTVVADDAAETVLDLARGVHASTIVVGVTRSSRWVRIFRSGVGERIIAGSGEIDVLMVSHPYARATFPTGRSRAGQALGRPRLVVGWLLAILAPLLITVSLVPLRNERTPSFEALLFLVATVVCALVGGLWPALAAALLGSLLLNFFFTPPLHTLSIGNAEDVVALLLFLLVAVAVASVVGTAARRAVQADRARREADTLSLLNQTLLRGDHDLDALLDLVRETFAMASVALLARPDAGGDATAWQVVGSSGPHPPSTPEEGDVSAEASATARLVLKGRRLQPHDLRVLSAFATHLAVAVDRDRLAAQTAAAQRLEEGNRLRTALLAAVSHDLRTPLAGIKAAVSVLRAPEAAWSKDDQADLLAAIEDSADRLGAIIANLLDMSRLRTGGLHLVTQDIGLDDIVARSVRTLGDADRIDVDVSPDLPAVRVDAGLLERVTANLVENALRYAPGPDHVEVLAASAPPWVRLCVVDHGPRGHRRRQATAVPAVPAAGRRARRRGRGAGPGGSSRADRGPGGNALGRGHPWRRPHHGRRTPSRWTQPAPS